LALVYLAFVVFMAERHETSYREELEKEYFKIEKKQTNKDEEKYTKNINK
jgi:hypothetical protein